MASTMFLPTLKTILREMNLSESDERFVAPKSDPARQQLAFDVVTAVLKEGAGSITFKDVSLFFGVDKNVNAWYRSMEQKTPQRPGQGHAIAIRLEAEVRAMALNSAAPSPQKPAEEHGDDQPAPAQPPVVAPVGALLGDDLINGIVERFKASKSVWQVRDLKKQLDELTARVLDRASTGLRIVPPRAEVDHSHECSAVDLATLRLPLQFAKNGGNAADAVGKMLFAFAAWKAELSYHTFRQKSGSIDACVQNSTGEHVVVECKSAAVFNQLPNGSKSYRIQDKNNALGVAGLHFVVMWKNMDAINTVDELKRQLAFVAVVSRKDMIGMGKQFKHSCTLNSAVCKKFMFAVTSSTFEKVMSEVGQLLRRAADSHRSE